MTRTCVWRPCEKKGQPTSDLRCMSCGVPTEELAHFASGTLTVDVEAALSEPQTARPLIVTMNDIPGYRVTSVVGDVFGLVVMSRDYFSNLGAKFKTIVGGEIKGYTTLLVQSRNEARTRLWAEARSLGANAVIAFRFDCNEIGEIMSEVVAYGTAVTVESVPDGVAEQVAT